MEKITPQKAKNMLDVGEDLYLLDVRNQDEYAQGHLENAILIPLPDLEYMAGTEIPDMDKTVLVYCHSGKRAAQAAVILQEMGYSDVKSFGGITQWPYDVVK